MSDLVSTTVAIVDSGATAMALWRELLDDLGPEGPYIVGTHMGDLSCYFCGAWGPLGTADPHHDTCIYLRAVALVEAEIGGSNA